MEQRKRGSQPGAIKSQWTEGRIALLKKKYSTTANAELAAELNISERAVRSAAKRFDLRKSGRYWSEEDCKWLLDHWNAVGFGFAEIQSHFSNKTKWAIIGKYRELAGLR